MCVSSFRCKSKGDGHSEVDVNNGTIRGHLGKCMLKILKRRFFKTPSLFHLFVRTIRYAIFLKTEKIEFYNAARKNWKFDKEIFFLRHFHSILSDLWWNDEQNDLKKVWKRSVEKWARNSRISRQGSVRFSFRLSEWEAGLRRSRKKYAFLLEYVRFDRRNRAESAKRKNLCYNTKEKSKTCSLQTKTFTYILLIKNCSKKSTHWEKLMKNLWIRQTKLW